MIKNNQITNNMGKLLKILLKDKLKTDKEVHYIYNNLKKSSFFNNSFINKENNLTDNDLMILCKNLKYVKFKEFQLIIRENDYSDLNIFYIIKGKVAIFKESIIKEKKIENNLTNDEIFINNLIKKNKNFKNKTKYLGEFLRIIKKNNLIGENALLSNNKKRTASIISLNEVEMIYISKKVFETKLYKIIKTANNKKEKFIYSVFKENWKKDIVDKIFYSIKIKEYTRNNIILKEDTYPDKIYFIYHGNVKLFAKNINNKQNILNKAIFKPNIDLENLNYANYFGEEIIFDPKFKLRYSAIVESSTCLIYTLNINEVKNIIGLYELIRSSLYKYYTHRKVARESKIKNYLNIIKSNQKLKYNNKFILKSKNIGNLSTFNKLKINTKNELKNVSLYNILKVEKRKFSCKPSKNNLVKKNQGNFSNIRILNSKNKIKNIIKNIKFSTKNNFFNFNENKNYI